MDRTLLPASTAWRILRKGAALGEESLETTRGLVEAAQVGDDDALRELFVRYYPIVVRIAELRLGRRIRGRIDAEDVAQETLLEAFRSLSRFRHRSEGGFRNWLSTILEHNVRDLGRRQDAGKRGGGREKLHAELGETSLSSSIFGAAGATPSQVLMGEELEARLEKAILEHLVGPYREVVILRNLCGMTYPEVAAEMGYDRESTVRSLHARAMGKLSSLLSDDRVS